MCYTSVIIFPFLTFNSGMECFAYPMTRRYASRLASTFSNTLCRRRTWSRSFVVIQNRSRTKRKPECWSELENTEQLTRISSLMLFVFLGKGAHLTDFTEKFGNLWRDKWKLDVASYVYIFTVATPACTAWGEHGEQEVKICNGHLAEQNTH